MEIWKITMCDNIYSSPRPSRYNHEELGSNLDKRKSTIPDQTPPISLVKKEPKNVNEYDIINIKMCRNLSDANSETYELKIVTFEHGQPEEFLALVKNFKKLVEGTGTTTAAGNIN